MSSSLLRSSVVVEPGECLDELSVLGSLDKRLESVWSGDVMIRRLRACWICCGVKPKACNGGREGINMEKKKALMFKVYLD